MSCTFERLADNITHRNCFTAAKIKYIEFYFLFCQKKAHGLSKILCKNNISGYIRRTPDLKRILFVNRLPYQGRYKIGLSGVKLGIRAIDICCPQNNNFLSEDFMPELAEFFNGPFGPTNSKISGVWILIPIKLILFDITFKFLVNRCDITQGLPNSPFIPQFFSHFQCFLVILQC